jgi:hypothetical protein
MTDALANRYGYIEVSTDEFPRPDERAIYMLEHDHLTENYTEQHRFQQVGVMRSDKATNFERDLGPSSGFRHEGVNIQSAVKVGRNVELVHSVGELMDIHEGLRYTDSFVEANGVINTNLVDRFLEEIDIRRRLLSGMKVFGVSSPHPDVDWRRVPDKGENKEW